MGYYAITSLILFLVLSLHHLRTTCEMHDDSFYIYNADKVIIINTYPLFVHCQSKDDDLGYRTLLVGQQFDWKFHIQFFGRTLYFCHFWWQNKDKRFC